MLRRFAPVLLALWLALLAPAWAQSLAAIPPLDSPVVDQTGTLNATQRQQLLDLALELQQRKGSQLQVLIVASVAPETIEQYSQRVFDGWKLGRKGVDDGVLLAVAKDDRRVRIQTGYGLEGAIPDAVANRVIQEYLVPRFRQGDYAGGIRDAATVLVRLVEGEALPAPVSAHSQAAREGGGGGGGGWWVALFIGFLAANLVRGLFRRAPRPLRGLLSGAVAGAAALLLTSLWLASGLAALLGLLIGLLSASPGSVVRYGGWGGWGGGGFGGGGGGGGGGWSGGGGSSGGGGASGSW